MQLQYAISVFDDSSMRYVCLFVTQNESIYEYEYNRLIKQGYTKVDDTYYENSYIKRKITRFKRQ